MRDNGGINTSRRDFINFFDIHYNRGNDWFLGQYDSTNHDFPFLDATQSYCMSWLALNRIASLPEVPRCVLTIRNPVDRAFSHYWHSKKKGDINFAFKPLKNYDRFSSLIEAGLLAPQIRFLYDKIGRENLKIVDFRDISKRPSAILRECCEFYEIERGKSTERITKVINGAGPRRTRPALVADTLWRKFTLPKSSGLGRLLYTTLTGRTEFAAGVDPEIRYELMKLIEPDIEEMAELTDLDLSDWTKIA